MREAFLLAAVALAGCSGSSGDVYWVISTNFYLDEGASGGQVATREGLYFQVTLSSDEGCSWALSFYDGDVLEVHDHWVARRAGGGLRWVWVLKTASPGESRIEFDEYPAGSTESQRRATYFLEVAGA